MVREYIDLIKASLKDIEPDYYRVITTYDNSGIVRERVFCYELYHQMRSRMQAQQIPEVRIHGEIDKRGHRDFKTKHWKNPDFIFHVPGIHEFNTLVVEVKGTLNYDRRQKSQLNRVKSSRSRKASTALNDIKNLLIFITNYSYAAGVFILYNHTFEQLIASIGESLQSLKQQPNTDRLYILTINTHNSTCEEHILFDI